MRFFNFGRWPEDIQPDGTVVLKGGQIHVKIPPEVNAEKGYRFFTTYGLWLLGPNDQMPFHVSANQKVIDCELPFCVIDPVQQATSKLNGVTEIALSSSPGLISDDLLVTFKTPVSQLANGAQSLESSQGFTLLLLPRNATFRAQLDGANTQNWQLQPGSYLSKV